MTLFVNLARNISKTRISIILQFGATTVFQYLCEGGGASFYWWQSMTLARNNQTIAEVKHCNFLETPYERTSGPGAVAVPDFETMSKQTQE